MHLSKNNKYKAVVRIDQISLMGSEGENTIGDPRDFNSYRDVVTALGDPRRQSYSRHPKHGLTVEYMKEETPKVNMAANETYILQKLC